MIMIRFIVQPFPGAAVWERRPERACLADGLGRDHSGQGDAAGRGRESVQAGRGDLREIPDHTNLNRVRPPAR
jgi:hypothetical protein